jgi:hypothetical protein
VEGGQALRLVLELATRDARKPFERFPADAIALEPPGPATVPSTRNVETECGVRVLNTSDRYSSGRTFVRRAWTSSVASQVGRNRTGAGVS